jgi:hypothetical protein
LTDGFLAALGRSPSVNRSATGRWSFLKFLPEAASTSGSATGGGIGVMQPAPLGHDLKSTNIVLGFRPPVVHNQQPE